LSSCPVPTHLKGQFANWDEKEFGIQDEEDAGEAIASSQSKSKSFHFAKRQRPEMMPAVAV
jgi:hypothetical protein